jgi:DNA helicase HerA-like ATPase
MHDFEKLGAFYLGRRYELARKQPSDSLFLYDSKDLVTHAVCVGMTGSGKTGLCITLLEEAAIDGIPAIVIDPKGDLGNLLLTFPDLRAEDFEHWVNEDDARRKGINLAEYARAQADLWRSGLAEWKQDGERIRRMRDTSEFAIYTPGSNAGLTVSVLGSFAAPESTDPAEVAERAGAMTAALLGLLGIEADPIKSPEYILVSTILNRAWAEGRDLDLPGLIRDIQNPPIDRVGVLDVNSFFPPDKRFSLAMSINNLLASPGFQPWLEGEPLDVARLLHSDAGKPRVSIFSIAHLAETERMFFVSLLLNQVVGWMRRQSGTSSLRAIVYMDEIFGYFPPVANPPSKQPLLTLLKQARAFGVGVVLATQNPVDLDYKGLSNAGTWFIGRLQTERDKARVLDGLEGAAATGGGGFDRSAMEATLAALGNRVFLVNNVHEDAPEVFETRWAMSYLRGPMTRAEIARVQPKVAVKPELVQVSRPSQTSAERPVLAPDVPQYYIPGAATSYVPVLYAASSVRFTDAKTSTDLVRRVRYLVPIGSDATPVDWDASEAAEIEPDELQSEASPGARFGDLPAAAAKAKSYVRWSKDFTAWLAAHETLELYRCPQLKLVSTPEESQRDFAARVQQAGREARDAQAERLRQKYSPKIALLEDRLRRAELALQREKADSQEQKLQSVLSIGAGVLDAFLGRKRSIVTRTSSAARTLNRARKEAIEVERAEETIRSAQESLDALRAQFEWETAAIAPAADIETVAIRPKKANISIELIALAWRPAQYT